MYGVLKTFFISNRCGEYPDSAEIHYLSCSLTYFVDQILKRRFGDQNLIKTALYQQFSDTRSAGPQLNGIRTAVKMINKICKRLNAYKKEINYPRRVALIEKWLPPEIPIELEETKLVCPDWNIRILMSLERNFIN